MGVKVEESGYARRVNVRIPPEIEDWLQEEATRRGGPEEKRGSGVGYSEIVREALDFYREWSMVRIGDATPTETKFLRVFRLLTVRRPAFARDILSLARKGVRDDGIRRLVSAMAASLAPPADLPRGSHL